MRMRYIQVTVQIATETGKTIYYPKKKDRLEITTRRRKIEIKIDKITNPKGKKNKKFKLGKEAKEIKKPRNQEGKHTKECMYAQILADYRLVRYTRGV